MMDQEQYHEALGIAIDMRTFPSKGSLIECRKLAEALLHLHSESTLDRRRMQDEIDESNDAIMRMRKAIDD